MFLQFTFGMHINLDRLGLDRSQRHTFIAVRAASPFCRDPDWGSAGPWGEAGASRRPNLWGAPACPGSAQRAQAWGCCVPGGG